MTWLLASVLCNIVKIISDNYQKMSFPSYNVLCMCDYQGILAVVHRNVSLLTNTNIGRTYCPSRGSGIPLQLAAIRGSIQLVYKEHFGCFLFHSDMKLTI